MILFEEPLEIQEPASFWEVLIRWGLGIVVIAILVVVFFWRRCDFRIRVRDGKVDYRGRIPFSLRPALEEFLLSDLAIKGPITIYAIRTNRRWQLLFRGRLSGGDKQRIRNFVVTRLGGS